MALILGLNYLPTILLQPFTGALVEHLSKKKVMIIFDIGRGLVVALGVLFYLRGLLTPPLLIAFTLIISTMEAFRSPAGAAIVPKLISPDLYKVGVALNQSASRVTELIGLAVAGGVVALIGCQGALLIDAGTFFISALIIAFIHLEESLDRSKINVASTFESFKDGFGLVRNNRILLVLLLIGALMNFTFVPINSFAVPFVVDVLHGGAEMFSVMEILMVASMAVGSAIAPKITRISGRAQLIGSGLIEGAALCLFSFGAYLDGIVWQYGIVFFSCLLLGFFAGIINVVFSAAFLKARPAGLHGAAFRPVHRNSCGFHAGRQFLVLCVCRGFACSRCYSRFRYSLLCALFRHPSRKKSGCIVRVSEDCYTMKVTFKPPLFFITV